MGTTTTTTTKVSVFTGEATKLRKQIESYQKLLDDKTAAMKEAGEKVAENKGLVVQYTDEGKAADFRAEEMKKEVIPQTAARDDAKTAYDNANNEINASIARTKVMPELIVDFLQLTNKIIPTVSKQNGDTQKLIASIESLHFFLDRDCNSDARIRDVFVGGRYDRLAMIFNQNEVEYCKDITGNEDFMKTDIVPLLKDAISKAGEDYTALMKEEHKGDDDEAFNAKKAVLEKLKLPWNFLDKNKVKAVVVDPDQKWKEEQAKKVTNNKTELDTFCPIMVRFFDAAYKAIKLSLDILEINQELNGEQKKALESAPKDNEENKAIEPPKDDGDSKEAELAKEKDKKAEKEMLDFSGIGSIAKNKELSNAIDENTRLISIVVTDLNIVGSAEFKNDFDGNENTTAKVFALAVQDAMLQMMKCQGAERGQVLLALKILALKPANIDIKTNQFWIALDEGIKQIFTSVSKLNEASAKFFGFFLRLQDSFAKYKKFGQDISYLKQDLNDFIAFKAKYGAELDSLSNNALKTIVDCVKQNIGDKTVEIALQTVEKLRNDYAKAEADYNIAYANHVQAYFVQAQKAAEFNGKREQAQQMADFYTKFQKDNQDDKAIKAKMAELNTQLADPKTSDYTLVDKKIVRET